MKDIIKLIEMEQEKLSQSEFLKWLADSTIPASERLSFTPSMLFFIMGFKDLLSSIHIEKPKTKLENLISTHCEEDLHHWKWYISDLQSLGYAGLGADLMDFSSKLWSSETIEARNLVYKAFKYHDNKSSLVLDLVLIEILEATFGAFVESMKKCVEEADLYTSLKYFGKEHHDAEESHESGNWIDGESLDCSINSISLTPVEKNESVSMIIDLFECFSDMFKMWHKNAGAGLHPAASTLNSGHSYSSQVNL